ncbi:SAM-dependent methyltransferase [Streptomyces iranensis]|uniref:SAM-dependent methyltransferase n=1 Tax=Streptomyces iranensis TaxID=576784 RepID=UPI0039B7289D
MTQHTADRPVFDYMRGYVTCAVLASLEKLGVLDKLADGGLTGQEVAEQYEDFLADATLRYLTQRGVLHVEKERYTLTELGQDLYAERGYLLWLAGGYGESLNSLDTILNGKHTFGADVDRDVRWVAVGSALIGEADLREQVMAILGRIEFDTIADIGCGNGHFLIDLCRATDARGVGYDISPASCAEATGEVAKAGLGDRITIVEADATDVGNVPRLGDVQLVMAFFFMHEVLEHGRDVLVDYLTQMCRRLPEGAYILTAEIAPPEQDEDTAEYFSPEYVYTQALMKQNMMTGEQWGNAFTQAGFTVEQIVPGRLPGSRLILVRKAVRP